MQRRQTDGSSSTSGARRSKSSIKRRTQEFLRRSSAGVLPPMDSTINNLEQSKSLEDAEMGYRSDTSDNGDDLEEVQAQLTPAPSPSKEKSEGGKPVARLKRSISDRFRSSSSKVNEVSPPIDDSLHKTLTNSAPSLKSFTKMLKKAIHVDQIDSKGQSILHICCSRGMTDFVKLLIKRGADVNLQDAMGYTPLHIAAIERRIDVCQLLVEAKTIDVNLTTKEHSNVLHYLARVPVDENDLVGFRRVLDSLLEKGINPNRVNAHLEAPIHFACMKSNVQSVALLLERGADCNLPTALNETPLHYAVRAGSSKLVRMLMENGADPTFQADDECATPVDVAEQYQCADVLACLQSIIEEELITDHETSSVISPRLRVLENAIIKKGTLEVIQGTDWNSYYVVVNRNRIACYAAENQLKPVLQVSLTRTEVVVEQGTIITDDGLQRWCFSTTEPSDRTISFGTRLPEEMEEWVDAFEFVIREREKLSRLYEKLKAQSKPRKRLRVKERNLAIVNCVEGTKRLLSSTNAEQMCNFLLENTEQAAAALSKIVNTEDEKIIKVITKYLIHKDRFTEFLKSSLNHDIRITAMGETLFREMSLSTRLLSSYLDCDHGKEYLRWTISPLLNDISESEHSLELNPDAVGLHRSVNVQANLDRIVSISQRFFDRVISSPNRFPFIFRDALYHTRVKVDQVFPNMTHAVVGGFVFLRFICPAIVTPHKFGLTKSPDKARREAVLITKILQTVSNGVEFDGSKEDYMRKLNPFIKGNRLCVTVFFDSLTNPQSIEKQRKLYTPPKKLSKEEVESCQKKIFEHVCVNTQRMRSILRGKIRVCMPLQDDGHASDDEHSGVEADES